MHPSYTAAPGAAYCTSQAFIPTAMISRKSDAEHTPLLRNEAVQDGTAARETPLPKLQILLLTITRLAEPLAFAVLFPFVNAMVLRTGETSVESVGYYVGLIESMFSFTQMFFRTLRLRALRAS